MNFQVNLNDEIISAMCVVNDGKMVWTPSRPLPSVSAKPDNTEKPKENEPGKPPCAFYKDIKYLVFALFTIAILIGISYSTYDSFMALMMTFILAVIIGYMVIWNVVSALHTPLMSVTNAISGIIVVGAMLCLEPDSGTFDEGSSLGILAVFFASINIWGGFIVTQKMLLMFKTRMDEDEL